MTPLMLNTAKMSASNIIMYLLPFVVTPILSRIYRPESFGEWGVFSSFIAIVTTVLFLGFDNTIVKVKDKDVANVTLLCLVTSLLFIILISIVFFVGYIADISFFRTFPAPKLLILYLLFYSFYTIFYNLSNRQEKYSTLAITNIIQGSSQAAFRIMFGVFCLTSINGLILGTTIAEGISSLFLFFCIIKLSDLLSNINISFTRIKELIIKLKNFPLFDAPSSMLSFAAFNLPVIILAIYFDKKSIGCFSIILQLLLLPMSFIGSAMGKVYYQELCKNDYDSNIISNTTDKVIKIVSIISIIPLLFIACGGDKLIIFFLGSKWQTAGDIALCLSIWSFPTILTQPLIPLFRLLNKQKTLLFFDSMYFLCGIGSILITCSLSHNLYFILIIFSIACFFVKVAMFLKILSLSHLSLKLYNKFLPLWITAFVILTARLIQL
jgi:O-antigen/teichoic acid export membrane protein